MMDNMACDLHSERRDKAQLIHQSTMKNTTHVIPVDKTPEAEYAGGATITGTTGSTTVFVGKDVSPEKVTLLPIDSKVPVPPVVSPPP
eukprot:3660909-Karenia_brevis.AAC.1